MRVTLDSSCNACGLCVSACPDVFTLADETVFINVDEVPAEYEDDVQQIADECPIEAIHIE
jgi:ferredoxin